MKTPNENEGSCDNQKTLKMIKEFTALTKKLNNNEITHNDYRKEVLKLIDLFNKK